MTATYLSIDPGPTGSAYVVVDHECRVLEAAKVPNEQLRSDIEDVLLAQYDPTVAIEMVASYGMAVGADVFQTCVEIGRFVQLLADHQYWTEPRLVYRRDVKLHLCGSARAKDANIIQALVDRFAPGTPNKGKGTKAAPGWFHGFHSDVWQAYALAVYLADTQKWFPEGRAS